MMHLPVTQSKGGTRASLALAMPASLERLTAEQQFGSRKVHAGAYPFKAAAPQYLCLCSCAVVPISPAGRGS